MVSRRINDTAFANAKMQKSLIICYHRISDDNNSYLRPTNVADFANQMQYLSKVYKPVSLEEIVQHIKNGTPLPSKSIAITFDDGYRDIYENAYPILRKYGIPATIFLTTGYVGTAEIPLWDKAFYAPSKAKKRTPVPGILDAEHSEPPDRKTMHMPAQMRNQLDEKDRSYAVVDQPDARIHNHAEKSLMLSWEEVREMSDNGILFGSHTLTHPFLTKISRKQVQKEIYISKQIIEQQIGKSVTTFAYPGGDFDPDIEEIVKEAGYSAAVSTVPGYNSVCDDVYALRRNIIQLQSVFHKFFPLSFIVEVTGVVGHVRRIYHEMRGL